MKSHTQARQPGQQAADQPADEARLAEIARRIPGWAEELGFRGTGISGIDLGEEEPYLEQWLEQGYHAGMEYMERHGMKRARPAELLPGTLRVISVAMD